MGDLTVRQNRIAGLLTDALLVVDASIVVASTRRNNLFAFGTVCFRLVSTHNDDLDNIYDAAKMSQNPIVTICIIRLEVPSDVGKTRFWLPMCDDN